MVKSIIVASDHAGWELKTKLIPVLYNLGYVVEDAGTNSAEPVDYPQFTLIAALKIASGEYDKGIVFCGTGQGDAIVANKVPGVRAALCWDLNTAMLSRTHNDANMLVLGGWTTETGLAQEILKAWLNTTFEGGRHARRVNQIKEIETQMLMLRGKIHDISRNIENGMAVWPGDIPVNIKTISCEDKYNLTSLSLSAHTGTHVDTPRHFIKRGRGVEQLDLDVLMGPACVFHMEEIVCIDRQHLENLSFENETRLLLGTTNSRLTTNTSIFNREYVYLTEDAAQYMVERGIKLLAIDSPSVDSFNTATYPVHHILLSAGIVIVEGVDLNGVPQGKYELLCLPMKIKASDGAPARLVLREV